MFPHKVGDQLSTAVNASLIRATDADQQCVLKGHTRTVNQAAFYDNH